MDKMPFIPVSWGEVIDKITILEIKEQRISGEAALRNIRNELFALRAIVDAQGDALEVLTQLVDRLREVNMRLWNVEDAIRLKDRDGAFDADFVQLARSVYVENDERSALKREINRITGSALVEEKSYRN